MRQQNPACVRSLESPRTGACISRLHLATYAEQSDGPADVQIGAILVQAARLARAACSPGSLVTRQTATMPIHFRFPKKVRRQCVTKVAALYKMLPPLHVPWDSEIQHFASFCCLAHLRT